MLHRRPAQGKSHVLLVSTISALLIAVSLVTFHYLTPPRPAPLAQRAALYVWQREWSPPVVAAVQHAGGEFDDLMVLAAEAEFSAGAAAPLPVIRPVVNWAALAATGRKVWLVIRCPVRLAELLRSAETASAARADLAALGRETLAAARSPGVDVAGIQIDFDCPTSGLKDYALLVADLRRAWSGTPVAITALPTWLVSRDFAPLARQCDEFILQVHSLELPTTFDQPIILCRADCVGPWAARAARVGVPFRVALPTCGYRVIFDDAGKFAALAAEGPAPRRAVGGRERVVMPDPVELAHVAAALAASPPDHCLGVAWFRLPVATDRLNWPWATLEAVRAGREPVTAFTAEIRRPEPALAEVWITNTGERNVPFPVRCDVEVRRSEVVAFDLLNGFSEDDSPGDSSKMRLVGPAPAVGEPVMVGWLRLKASAATDWPRVKQPVGVVP